MRRPNRKVRHIPSPAFKRRSRAHSRSRSTARSFSSIQPSSNHPSRKDTINPASRPHPTHQVINDIQPIRHVPRVLAPVPQHIHDLIHVGLPPRRQQRSQRGPRAPRGQQDQRAARARPQHEPGAVVAVEEAALVLADAVDAHGQRLARERLRRGRRAAAAGGDVAAVDRVGYEGPVHHLVAVEQVALEDELERGVVGAGAASVVVQPERRGQRVQPAGGLVLEVDDGVVDVRRGRAAAGRGVAVDVVQDAVAEAAQGDLG